jgi:DNA-directed RNA polymerase specialized sigma24 family protein
MLLQIAQPEDQSHIEAHDRLYWFARCGYLRALCAGQKQTWDLFVVAATPLVNAVVTRAAGVRKPVEHSVADTVQEVFVRLSASNFQLLKQYDPARASLSTWLAVISWSAAIDARIAPSAETPRSRYECS